MLAAARSAAAEVARGLGTAAIVWAGSHPCPGASCECRPTLTCAEVAACPDCVCEGSRAVLGKGGGAPAPWGLTELVVVLA
eukprot:3163849-Lingulodinium_polyedra.AAC.1